MNQNGGIKRMEIKTMGTKKRRISASDVTDHLIRKRNARLSILSVPNAIKPAIEGLCAAPKRRIKTIPKRSHLDKTINRRMNLTVQGSH
jgi:UDP-N-acetylmuramate-alanine ligase